MKKILISIILILVPLSGFSKKKVAVFDFTSNNNSMLYEMAIREMVEVSLYKTRSFDILERRQIELILQEHTLQSQRCNDTTCVVEAGKILSADYVVYGSIIKLKNFKIMIKVLNVSTGQLEYIDSIESDSEENIDKAVDRTSKRISKKFRVNNEINSSNKYIHTSEYYYRGLIPGWAQSYCGSTIKSNLLIGSFAVAGLSTIGSYYYYKYKKREYDDLRAGLDENEYDKKYKSYKLSSRMFIASAGITSLIYIVNWIDVICFNNQKYDNTAFNNDRNSFFMIDNSLSVNYRADIVDTSRQLDLSISYKF